MRKLRSFIRGNNPDQYCRINSEDAGMYNGLVIQRKGHIQCNNAIGKATVFNVEITGSSSVSLQATTDDGSDCYCDNPRGSIGWNPRFPVVCKAETEKFQFKLSQYSHKENNMVCQLYVYSYRRLVTASLHLTRQMFRCRMLSLFYPISLIHLILLTTLCVHSDCVRISISITQ